MSRAHEHFKARNDGVAYCDDEMQIKPVRNYYGLDAWRPTGELRDNMRQIMRGVKYDTMIGTGISGSVFVARLAPVMGKDFAILRKDDDGSHMGRGLEGFVGKRWLFVDEFMSSGETIRRVTKFMQEKHPEVEFVGAYMYQPNENRFHDVPRLIDRGMIKRNADVRLASYMSITPNMTRPTNSTEGPW